MPLETTGYKQFLEHLKVIVKSWGDDGQHNDRLWTTSSWSEHLLNIIDEDVWDGQTRPVQERALNIFALHPKPDIYDVTFPSVERFRMIGMQIRDQAQYFRRSWLRRQTTWEFERLTAILTYKLLKTNPLPNLEVVEQNALRKLRFDRRFSPSSHVNAHLYQTWVQDITSVAEILSRSGCSKEQIIGAIGACSKIAKLTNPKEAGDGEEISAKLLIDSYLPNSNQFRTLSQVSLEDVRRKMVALSSHQSQSSSNPYAPISRTKEMIEEIVKIYAEFEQDDVRAKLTLLVKSASSEGRVDERVIAYLRELPSKGTIHQLPYPASLPTTLHALVSKS